MKKLILTKFVDAPSPHSRTGHNLLVTARPEGGADPNVFVYHEAVQGGSDVFEAVASLNQLHEIPVTRGSDPEIPYYRTDRFEVVSRNVEELKEVWEYVKIDVARLMKDVLSFENLRSDKYAIIYGGGTITEHDSVGEVYIELTQEPAGQWDGQEITDTTVDEGWLPVSKLEQVYGTQAPEGSKWFYRFGYDKQQMFATASTPVALYVDGLLLPPDAYSSDGSTLFWHEYEPVDGYPLNPWPDDYIQGVEGKVNRLHILAGVPSDI
jgi:hypothetical protein